MLSQSIVSIPSVARITARAGVRRRAWFTAWETHGSYGFENEVVDEVESGEHRRYVHVEYEVFIERVVNLWQECRIWRASQ
jgi:hypothetical protein